MLSSGHIGEKVRLRTCLVKSEPWEPIARTCNPEFRARGSRSIVDPGLALWLRSVELA